MSKGTLPDLPPALLSAVLEERIILFLGAGASLGALHDDRSSVPGSEQLRDLLADKFLGGALKNRPLAHVADICVNETDLIAVQGFIRDIFLGFKPAPFHELLPTFRWRAIATTNYDLIVERAYDRMGDKLQELVPFIKNGQRVEEELKRVIGGVQYLKLHGCINHYNDADVPLLLTTEGYVRYATNRSRLFDRLREWGHEYPFLFCGYAIADPHVQQILFNLFDRDILRPAYYVLTPNMSALEERYWTKNRLFPIKSDFENLLRALDRAIEKTKRSVPRAMGGGTATIRSHYRIAHPTESRNLLSFLEQDVLHVRRGLPVSTQDAAAFYRGYDTGWGAIERGLDIRRKIVDTVLVDAVLSAEDQRSDQVDLFVIKGPAGNGKSIVLKRVAWEAAHEFDKLVLFARPGGALRLDAIEELATLIQQRFFMFVDRAALHREELRSLLDFAKSRNIPLTLVTAERDNEWNVRCEDLDEFVSEEYPVRFLSEPEVHSLLTKLEEHKALGLLEPLSYQERVDAFLRRAERQLLVALHEATLGKPFVDIVLDEYRRIVPHEAQALYLDVCTLNRLGVGVRAGLIARISGFTFENFKERFFKPLEHVVRAYRDPYVQDNVYIARHQHVAELVFDNVLIDPEQRYDQLVRIVRGLNLDYSSDLTAFRQLIRGRVVAETFRSQELGRQFFAVAQSVAGEDPYLLQQLGLFEMRHEGGDLKRADAALTRAFALAPHDKTIQHSLANLARQQAQDATNPLARQALRELARKRLDGLIGSLARRPHGYYTSAQVALDELRDLMDAPAVPTVDPLAERKVVELAHQVEQYLAEGLQQFPENAQLLDLEARYREILDQHERAEDALRRAFSSNPRLDWIAIRLARRLADRGAIEEAKRTLRKCLDENPGSKLAHVNLAMLFMGHGTDVERSLVLDHLRRSFTDGDSNYDAQFWFARELFLQGQYQEASRLFDRLRHAPVPVDHRNRIRGLVRLANGVVAKFKGVVVKREESYLFVRADSFRKDIFAHMSVVRPEDWEGIRTGGRVHAEVGFNMRGPVCASVILEKE
jgi:tetratricopeptide (TPR) repeat protein/cold shock CspA family protein